MIRGILLLLPALALATGAAAQLPSVEVRAVTPEPATRLAPQQALYLHLTYVHDQPLRFQARGHRDGQERDQMRMNTAPAYPAAARGDAVVWLAGDPGARIDEIRVQVYDRDWNLLGVVPFPISAEWHAGLPEATTAAWAAELMAAQQALPAIPSSGSGRWFDHLMGLLAVILVPLGFLSVPGYPVLQVIALIRLRGPMRLLSALPLSFMLPVYGHALYALSQESNLWPIYMIFASPVALIITLIILVIGRRRQASGEGALG